MSGSFVEGGCFCGAVRIRAGGEPVSVPYCHCNDCRRWSGSPVSVFVGYRVGQVEMVRGTPRVYESSPAVTRSFCGDCGASLFYEDRRLPGEIYIAAGVFEEPGRFRPDAHSWASQGLPWLDIEDGLPREEESSRPR